MLGSVLDVYRLRQYFNSIVRAHHPRVVRRGRRRAADDLPLGRLLVTDRLAPAGDMEPPLEVCSIAPLLADAIGRLSGYPR